MIDRHAMMRHTRYDIDLDAIAHNFRQVKACIHNPVGLSPKTAVVLKADAYGLGALPVARVLIREGADMLAVACLPEAIQLRQAYDEVPILIMGHTPSEYFDEAVSKRITCTIFDYEQAKSLASEAKAQGTIAKAHVKVDTGMNRLGLKPGLFKSGAFGGDSGFESAALLLARMAELPGLKLEGAFTHLALNNRASDAAQFDMFMNLMEDAAKRGVHFDMHHVCDSIGLMRYPEYRLDLVRPGAVMYGVVPMNTPLSQSIDIRTPFRFSTRISRLRPLSAGEGVGYDYTWKAPEEGALVATLPVGYADGYKRCLSNVASVVIRGRRAPVVGLICMDQCNVDVSAVPGVSEGDEVLLLGGWAKDKPEACIPVLEMASWGSTNRNDVICSVGRRVPRAYSEGGRIVSVSEYVLGGV